MDISFIEILRRFSFICIDSMTYALSGMVVFVALQCAMLGQVSTDLAYLALIYIISVMPQIRLNAPEL